MKHFRRPVSIRPWVKSSRTPFKVTERQLPVERMAIASRANGKCRSLTYQGTLNDFFPFHIWPYRTNESLVGIITLEVQRAEHAQKRQLHVWRLFPNPSNHDKSTKCRMMREMVHQMSSDILRYMSHHWSRYSWEDGWSRCTDNRTIHILDRGLNRLQMTMWSRIAPWLKIFLQKEWVSLI